MVLRWVIQNCSDVCMSDFSHHPLCILLARWVRLPGRELRRLRWTACGSFYGRPTEGWGQSALWRPIRCPTSTTSGRIQCSCRVSSHDGLRSGAVQNKCRQGVQHFLPLWQRWKGEETLKQLMPEFIKIKKWVVRILILIMVMSRWNLWRANQVLPWWKWETAMLWTGPFVT